MNRDQTTFTSTPAALDTTTTTRTGELFKCTNNNSTGGNNEPMTIKSSMKLSPLRRRPRSDPFARAAVKKEEKRRPKASVVTFAENVQVIQVARLSELAEENNRDEIWWNDSEIDKINAKAYAVAQKLQTGTSKRYCRRGLEDFLNRKDVEGAQSAAWEAVLVAQAKHLNRDDDDNKAVAGAEQAISMAYMRTTWESKIAATKRAINDEEAIQKYTKDTRRMIRKL